MKMVNRIIILVILSILLFYTHQMRALRYDIVPEPFLDEWTHVWTGLSVRNSGIPMSWSDLRTYWNVWPKYQKEIETNKLAIEWKDFNTRVNDQEPSFPRSNKSPELILYTTELDLGHGKGHISLMQPHLDYPPLGGIILSTAISPSVKTYQDVQPKEIRTVSLWLGSITLLLIFLLTIQVFNNPIIALIAAAAYGTAPTFLISSRFALLENVLIPMCLLSLNTLVFAINNKNQHINRFKVLLVIAGIFAGLAFLVKPTGIAISLAGIITLIFQREKVKTILFYILPAAFISSLYLIYGYLLAPTFFIQILIEESSNRIFAGALSFITGFFKFGASEFPIDGWWVGGFISLLFLPYTKKSLPLLITVFSFIFIILFMGASFFPWYLIPMIPFMAIGIGNLFYETIVSPKTSHILVIFLFFFLSSFYWTYGVHGSAPNFVNHQQQYLIYKILLVGGFGAALIGPILFEKNKLFRKIWMIGMVLFIIGMIYLNHKSLYYIIGTWGHLSEHYPHNWGL